MGEGGRPSKSKLTHYGMSQKECAVKLHCMSLTGLTSHNRRVTKCTTKLSIYQESLRLQVRLMWCDLCRDIIQTCELLDALQIWKQQQDQHSAAHGTAKWIPQEILILIKLCYVCYLFRFSLQIHFVHCYVMYVMLCMLFISFFLATKVHSHLRHRHHLVHHQQEKSFRDHELCTCPLYRFRRFAIKQ